MVRGMKMKVLEKGLYVHSEKINLLLLECNILLRVAFSQVIENDSIDNR